MVERRRRSGRKISARARQVIVVRAAVASDAPTLAALRWAFRAGRAAAREDQSAFVARCADWMRRELQAAGRWRCWVATRDQGDPAHPQSAIIGQVWLQILPKVPNPIGERDRHAYLSNLYVAPEARGGVGSRLPTPPRASGATYRFDRYACRSRSPIGFGTLGRICNQTCPMIAD